MPSQLPTHTYTHCHIKYKEPIYSESKGGKYLDLFENHHGSGIWYFQDLRDFSFTTLGGVKLKLRKLRGMEGGVKDGCYHPDTQLVKP